MMGLIKSGETRGQQRIVTAARDTGWSAGAVEELDGCFAFIQSALLVRGLDQSCWSPFRGCGKSTIVMINLPGLKVEMSLPVFLICAAEARRK